MLVRYSRNFHVCQLRVGIEAYCYKPNRRILHEVTFYDGAKISILHGKFCVHFLNQHDRGRKCKTDAMF